MVMRCIVPPSFVICCESQKLLESWICPMRSSLPMLKISTGDVWCAWSLEDSLTRPLPIRGRGSIGGPWVETHVYHRAVAARRLGLFHSRVATTERRRG